MKGYNFICVLILCLTVHKMDTFANDDCNTHTAATCDSSQTALYALVSDNCNTYCQCVPQSTQEDGTTIYTWMNRPCPEGLQFNNGAQYCDWPDNVSCS